MTAFRFDEADIQRMVEMQRSGLTQMEIGAALGCSQATAGRYLRSAGIHASIPEPTPEGTKRCQTCREVKPLTEFYPKSKVRSGLCGTCKNCMARASARNRASMRHRAKKVYGLTLEAYDSLKAASDACPICKEQADLHLDHDETTGKIREFICGKCNRGLGMFDHDPARMQAAIDYLWRH